MHTTTEVRGTFSVNEDAPIGNGLLELHVYVDNSEVHMAVDSGVEDQPIADVVLTEHDLNVLMALCQLAFRKAEPQAQQGPPNPAARVLH